MWMLKLVHAAAEDEIRHTQISFDIAAAYLGYEKCAMAGPFPSHQINIDGDWNRIATDTAMGGCIGETMAAFRMKERIDGTLLDEYVQGIAVDEVKHAALAWTVVKWMIDHKEGLDVASEEWWNTPEVAHAQVETVFVHSDIIPSIRQQMKAIADPHVFYHEIIQTMMGFMDIKIETRKNDL